MSIFLKLLKCQKEIQNPTKNAKNPFLKNNYADLGAVVDVVKSVCNNNGIFVVQECHVSRSNPNAIEVLTHFIDADVEMGQISHTVSTAVLLKEISPQGTMGAFTYGRRYGLLSAFCLIAEDDDGNAASGKDSKIDDAVLSQDKTTTVNNLKGILGKGNK